MPLFLDSDIFYTFSYSVTIVYFSVVNDNKCSPFRLRNISGEKKNHRIIGLEENELCSKIKRMIWNVLINRTGYI